MGSPGFFLQANLAVGDLAEANDGLEEGVALGRIGTHDVRGTADQFVARGITKGACARVVAVQNRAIKPRLADR